MKAEDVIAKVKALSRVKLDAADKIAARFVKVFENEVLVRPNAVTPEFDFMASTVENAGVQAVDR